MDGSSNYPWIHENISFTGLMANIENAQENNLVEATSLHVGGANANQSEDPEFYIDQFGIDHEDNEDENEEGEEVLTPSARMALEATTITPTWNIAEEPDPRLMNLWQTWNNADPFSSQDHLAKGQQFNCFDDLEAKITKWSISRGKEFKVNTHSSDYYLVDCVQRINGCPWRLSARRVSDCDWIIVKCDHQHSPTCVRDFNKVDNRNVTEKFICHEILPVVRNDLGTKPSVIIAMIEKDYHVTVSYKKAWNAKQRAIAVIFGDWEESYRIVPRFLAAAQQCNPGTIVQWSTVTTIDGQGCIFGRVFWSFGPSIQGFEHCRHVISIDGSHLYGKYKGTLLTALAFDANSQIFPLAFSIVESENNSSWNWFMDILGRHVTQRSGLCVVSDRHQGIMKAMKDIDRWREPNAFHRICVSHLSSNFHDRFKDKILKKLVGSTAYAHEKVEFERRMDTIGLNNPSARKYLEDIGKDKWSSSYDDGHRYGIMTINGSECFNGVMKGVRSLPITAIVKQTFYKLNSYFVKRSDAAHQRRQEGHQFSTTIATHIEDNMEIAQRARVETFGSRRNVYEVNVQRKAGYDRLTYHVDLLNRTCNCQRWMNLKIPCPNVLAVCRVYGFDHRPFVDPFYSMQSLVSTYNVDFNPAGDIVDWPIIEGPPVVPDPTMMREPGRAGRRKEIRFLNEMDRTSVQGKNQCSVCDQQGHNKRTCPSRASGSGSG